MLPALKAPFPERLEAGEESAQGFSFKAPHSSCKQKRSLRWGSQSPNILCLPEACPTLVLTVASTSHGGLSRKKPQSDSDQRPKWIHTLKL